MSDRPPRSLEQALADLQTKLKTLPLTHPDRGAIARQIVGLEDEIAARAQKEAP